MVSKYIFEQLGAEIGDGIFNGHLPLLCEFSASDWAENISCPIRIKSKSAQTLLGCAVVSYLVPVSKRARREKVRENHRGLFTAGPPF